MTQHVPPVMPGMAEVVRVVSTPYEKKFANEVIHHRRNLEKDMLVALAVFVRRHGRAALGFTR